MSVKLKFTFGVLFAIALIFVARFSIYLKNNTANISMPVVKGISNLEAQDPLTKDTDHDGIPDVKEAYYRTDPLKADSDGDGFKDGEEVASGFNPVKKETKTGQVKGKKTSNVTATLSERFVAGIFAGDINPRNGTGDKFNNGMNSLALAAIDDALDKISENIDNSSILITNGSVTSQEEYLKNIASILEGPFLTAFMQQPQILNQALLAAASENFDDANKIFANYNLKFTQAYTALLATPAPDNWVDFHKHLLNFFQKMSIEYSYAMQWQEDPMLALTAISDLARSLGGLDTSIVEELRFQIQKNNLTVPNTNLFQILGLLNNSPLKP